MTKPEKMGNAKVGLITGAVKWKEVRWTTTYLVFYRFRVALAACREQPMARNSGTLGPCTYSARRLLRVIPCLAPAAAALTMVRLWWSSAGPSVAVRDGASVLRPDQASHEDLASTSSVSCAIGVPDRGEDVGGERYLLYQPQFGLSNQIVALRNAVVWALLLNRTLVLPHLLGHGTAQLRAAHSSAFDVESARAAVAPLRLVEMEPWLRLGIAPQVLATSKC